MSDDMPWKEAFTRLTSLLIIGEAPSTIAEAHAFIAQVEEYYSENDSPKPTVHVEGTH